VYLVGLTGGIASGKTTVAQRFAEHGAELIDADDVAREVVLPGTEAYRKILEHFGEQILDEDGLIDRPALGRIVFSDPDKRALLNELTHPPIVAAIADQLELLQAFDGVVVLDVPLLVESGVLRGYEAVVVVAAKPDVQLERLVRDRAMTETEALDRIAAQAPLEAKLAVATHVIWNEGSLDELIAKADEVAEELAQRARDKADREDRAAPDR
jgi:dephospho-CoA kinase